MKYVLDKKYDALERFEKWDDETRKVIKERIAKEFGDNLSYEFLSEKEGEILDLLMGALLPQNKNEEQINISKAIDQDLKDNPKKVRYGENPWPREFYQKGLSEFAAFAKNKFGKPLEDFSEEQIEKFVGEIFAGDPKDFLCKFLRKVLSDAAAIYYSHPKSWNEIGFPGPAYPEGYAYLDCNKAFPWEPKYEQE